MIDVLAAICPLAVAGLIYTVFFPPQPREPQLRERAVEYSRMHPAESGNWSAE